MEPFESFCVCIETEIGLVTIMWCVKKKVRLTVSSASKLFWSFSAVDFDTITCPVGFLEEEEEVGGGGGLVLTRIHLYQFDQKQFWMVEK